MFTAGNIIYIIFVITSVAATIHYSRNGEARKCFVCILITVCFCQLCYDNFEETNILKSVPERYETLLAKVENADDMTMNLLQEVSDWNMEVTEGREKEQDLWNRIFLPVVYDKVDIIDITIENAEYANSASKIMEGSD